MQTRGIARRGGPVAVPSRRREAKSHSASRAPRSGSSLTPTTPATAPVSSPASGALLASEANFERGAGIHSGGSSITDDLSAALVAAAPAHSHGGEDGALDNDGTFLMDQALGSHVPPLEEEQVVAGADVDEANEPLSQDSILQREAASQDSVWREVLTGSEAAANGGEHSSQGSEFQGPGAASQESVTELLLRSYEEPLGASQSSELQIHRVASQESATELLLRAYEEPLGASQ